MTRQPDTFSLISAPVGTAAWCMMGTDQGDVPCLALRIADNETFRFDPPPKMMQSKCHVIRNKNEGVSIGIMLFRLADYELTFVNVINFCDWPSVDSSPLTRAIEENKFIVLTFESGEQPTGEFDVINTPPSWREMVQELAAAPRWDVKSFIVALQNVVKQLRPEELWSLKEKECTENPRVLEISSLEELQEKEKLLRMSGAGELVDALYESVRQKNSYDMLQNML